MTLLPPALRWSLALALIAAGSGKLLSADRARVAPMLVGDAPGAITLAVLAGERAIPALEILVGVATMVRAGRRVRHVLAAGLATSFVATALLLPDGVRCDCLGILGGFETRRGHLAASAGILAWALALWVVESRESRRRGKSEPIKGLRSSRLTAPESGEGEPAEAPR